MQLKLYLDKDNLGDWSEISSLELKAIDLHFSIPVSDIHTSLQFPF